jgi:hypothetical protein
MCCCGSMRPGPAVRAACFQREAAAAGAGAQAQAHEAPVLFAGDGGWEGEEMCEDEDFELVWEARPCVERAII